MDISGKGIVVTGASRGLGAALTALFVERGARVVGVARDAEALDRSVGELVGTRGRAFALAYDIGEKSSIHRLAAAAYALLGSIDVVIHNASILGPTPLRPLLDTECEDLIRVLDVNLIGPFRFSKAVAGNMALRGQGTIVHISSDASTEAYPNWGAYSISKAALDHLTRLWARELDSSGVRVFSVDPGEMNTRMHREALPDADPATLNDPRMAAQRILEMIEAGARVPSGARLRVQDWQGAA
jgi:NAD(P)-dependent dehydrogenase (short-subunit alcohol dehydrogenase family)